MEQPLGVALRIIEERDLERAIQALESAEKDSDVPSTPMVSFVKSMRSQDWFRHMQELDRNGV